MSFEINNFNRTDGIWGGGVTINAKTANPKKRGWKHASSIHDAIDYMAGWQVFAFEVENSDKKLDDQIFKLKMND